MVHIFCSVLLAANSIFCPSTTTLGFRGASSSPGIFSETFVTLQDGPVACAATQISLKKTFFLLIKISFGQIQLIFWDYSSLVPRFGSQNMCPSFCTSNLILAWQACANHGIGVWGSGGGSGGVYLQEVCQINTQLVVTMLIARQGLSMLDYSKWGLLILKYSTCSLFIGRDSMTRDKG